MPNYGMGHFTVRSATTTGDTVGGASRSERVRLERGVRPPNVLRPLAARLPPRILLLLASAFMLRGERTDHDWLAPMTVADEITSAIHELNLESRVRPLPPAEAERAIAAAQERFVAEPTALWWWDSLRPELFVESTSHAKQGYRFLPIVCPDIEAWLFASDDQAPPWPVFAGTPSVLSAVIGECRYFEYAIVSPTLDWIIFENHHNILVATGEPVASRLHQLAG